MNIPSPTSTSRADDVDGDGRQEWRSDLDNDGYFETIHYDTNGDGLIDTVDQDTNRNGQVDTQYTDLNQNGVAERIEVDVNEDLVCDQATVDANENGVPDENEQTPQSPQTTDNSWHYGMEVDPSDGMNEAEVQQYLQDRRQEAIDVWLKPDEDSDHDGWKDTEDLYDYDPDEH